LIPARVLLSLIDTRKRASDFGMYSTQNSPLTNGKCLFYMELRIHPLKRGKGE